MNDSTPSTTPVTNPLNTMPPEGPRKRPSTPHNPNRKFIIAIVILTILALGGIGFGAYGMIQLNNANNNKTSSKESTTITNNQETIETVEENNTTEPAAAPTKSEAVKFAMRTLINKYIVSDYYTEASNIFQVGLQDEEYRMLVAVKSSNSSYIPNTSGIYHYDPLNNIYKDLFGQDQNLTKKDYNSPCATYSFSNNSFKYSTVGCGGSLIPSVTYTIADYYLSDDNLIIDTAYALTEYNPEKTQNNEIAKYIELSNGETFEFYPSQMTNEQALAKVQDSVPHYRFTFTPESTGNYVLTAFSQV
ncbi:hypothetical protein IJ096_01835 [Candidatus Saccharibacteria bacterium]|nr:hypothetical protein [Candidatus Saccharibacteria bacterium]